MKLPPTTRIKVRYKIGELKATFIVAEELKTSKKWAIYKNTK